jgi:hypothetical protein
MPMKSLALTVVVLTLAVSTVAEAQPRPAPGATPARRRPMLPERVFISVGGVFQIGANDFVDSATVRENAENGRLETDYNVGAGPAFDVSGGVVVWRNLALGVGLTRFSKSTVTSLNASVPHPFFFNQLRSVTGEFSGTRKELAVHIQAKGIFPLSNRTLFTVFGGPSFFEVEQSIVSDFDYTESYPFDTATFSRAIADTQSESKIGFNVGGDFSYFFSRQVGVGVTAQYAGATVEMTVPSGTADVKAGGGQIGGGLRLRF